MTRHDPPRLGHVYLPSSGRGVGTFDFIVDRDTGGGIQIGTPVAADTTEGTVVGTVVDMTVVGWADNPHVADLEGLGEPGLPDDRTETIVATVSVADAPSLRPVRAGWVRSATGEELARAAGSQITRWPIPCGAIELVDGSWVPLHLSGENLVGPEGGHLIVGGLSGVASKTSFMGVLLRCVLAAAERDGRRAAALIWNVKGTDLIDIDRPPAPGYELDDTDRALWSAFGVEPTPFPQVEVWAPGLQHLGHGGPQTASPRDDARPLRWDLLDIWDHLTHLLPGIEGDEKVISLLADAREQLMGRDAKKICSFNEFIAELNTYAKDSEGSNDPMAWGNHHRATVRRVLRMIDALPSRCGGLLTRGSRRPGEDIPVQDWEPGLVRVVDLAGLQSDVQSMAIARTTERLLKSAERNELGVDHLIIMMDELNQWAPSGSSAYSAARRVLRRAVTQGRFAGVSVFGAAQKISRIDDLIRDNAATRVLGRTADGELRTGVYGSLPGGLSERVATLERGQAVIWHPTFRTPMLVRFPRPAWQTGRAVGDRRRRADSLDVLGDLSATEKARLTSGIDPIRVEDILSRSTSVDDAVHRLKAARTPDAGDIQLTADASHRLDPNDPFDLGD